jgi:hypothetical protein
MTCSEIHTLSYGIDIEITIEEDSVVANISAATDMQFLIRKPDGSLLEVTATFLTDGTDGILKYTTVSGDLDMVGLYKIQAKMTIGTGVFYSTTSTFKVYSNV